jgi:AcrR family transcriptional regulator
MSGLRERKKKERRSRILEVSYSLFAKRGFADTSIEDIALEADLGVGTLYNYFTSKNDILVEVMEQRLEHVIRGAGSFTHNPDKDPAQAITGLLFYFLDFFLGFNNDIWINMFTAAFASDAVMSRGIGMDIKIIRQIELLLIRLSGQGAVRKDIHTESASYLIYSAFVFSFMGYLTVPDIDRDKLFFLIGDQVGLTVRGLM